MDSPERDALPEEDGDEPPFERSRGEPDDDPFPPDPVDRLRRPSPALTAPDFRSGEGRLRDPLPWFMQRRLPSARGSEEFTHDGQRPRD